MRRLFVVALLCALLGIAADASAAPVTVTFDDLPAGTSANEAYAARGIHFGVSPQGAEGAVTVAASAGARSAPNAGAFQYDGSMSHAWMRFDTAQSQVTLHTCAESGSNLSIDAIAVDASGNQVDSQLGIPCTAGTPTPITLAGAANISYVAVGVAGPGWVVDDITFDGVASAPPQLGAPTGAAPPLVPRFGIVANVRPRTIAIGPGESETLPMTITRSEGSNGLIRVIAAINGAPEGVTATMEPAELNGTETATTLRVTAAPNARAWGGTITVSATPIVPGAGTAQTFYEVILIVNSGLSARIEGMEITQGVQHYGQPYSNRYQGVRLVPLKKTVVRVFADYAGNEPRNGRPGFGVVLTAAQRPGEAQFPIYAPATATLNLNDEGLTVPERDTEGRAFTFVLPDSWTTGSLTLTAQLVAGGSQAGGAPLCIQVSCGSTPTWQLSGISFPALTKRYNFSALKQPQQPFTQIPIPQIGRPPIWQWIPTGARVDFAADPRAVFEKLLVLSPVPIRFYTASGALTNSPTWRATEDAPSFAILEAAQAYDARIRSPGTGTIGVFVAGENPGVQSGHTAVVSARTIPGGMWRPTTSIAHEAFHLMGFPHASKSCGASDGEAWPVADGRMNSIGLDTTSSSSAAGPFRVIADRDAAPRYDLMSYCQVFSGDPLHWVSARNWSRALEIGRPRPATLVQQGGLAVDAQIAGGQASIVSVGAAPGNGSADGEPSAYTLVARDAAGAELARVPMMQAELGGSGGRPTDPVMLRARLSPAGVSHVDVVRSDGAIVTSRTASATAPTVSVTTPRRGSATVRFRGGDADPGQARNLEARIDLSTDGGRTFRPVWTGLARDGAARIPREALLASASARVRVTVSDGFREATATSGRFAIAGHRPRVQIDEPAGGARADAGGAWRLQGGAIDDRGRPITGRRLVWRAGRTVLGRGGLVTARIPAGARRVTLTATDARGRTSSASVRVRTRAVKPYFMRLTASGRAPRRGGRVTLTVSSTQRATLSAGGERFTVTQEARRIRVRVPAGRSSARVRLVLSAGGQRTTTAVTVRRG
jgi:hypothetical protein